MQLVRWSDKLDNQNEISNPINVNTNEITAREHTVITQQHSSLRISPLPPPEDFAKYKEVMPDLPERIVKQFKEDSISTRKLQKEKQTAEIELQKTAQAADIAFDKRSQWMAFITIMSGLAGTILLAYLDKDAAAVATAIGTVGVMFRGIFSKNLSATDKKSDD